MRSQAGSAGPAPAAALDQKGGGAYSDLDKIMAGKD